MPTIVSKPRHEEMLKSPLLRSFLGGSLSATCSTIIFQPLDLVKTRIQTNTLGSGRELLREVGFRGLWTGLSPSLARTVPGVGVYFASVSGIRNSWPGAKGGQQSRTQAAVTGGLARAFAGCLLLPATVVKTRYECGLFKYSSLASAVAQISKTEGLRGLFCGLYPTLVRDVPFSSLYLLFYSELKSLFGLQNCTPAQSWAAGLSAGVLASLVTHPADVLKTTQQVGPTSGVVDTAKYLIRERPVGSSTISVFYKGLAPRMIRRSLMSALAWTVYEEINKNILIKS